MKHSLPAICPHSDPSRPFQQNLRNPPTLELSTEAYVGGAKASTAGTLLLCVRVYEDVLGVNAFVLLSGYERTLYSGRVWGKGNCFPRSLSG